ncbi:hypothetical protein LIER_26172 [Lithospermum erythrorhizon]|uniref:Uncharacterized protein n=1 Tax=Lithospermum erythrorhizon TaxID=34254 RepID=A0AAV3R7F7_LITER
MSGIWQEWQEKSLFWTGFPPQLKQYSLSELESESPSLPPLLQEPTFDLWRILLSRSLSDMKTYLEHVTIVEELETQSTIVAIALKVPSSTTLNMSTTTTKINTRTFLLILMLHFMTPGLVPFQTLNPSGIQPFTSLTPLRILMKTTSPTMTPNQSKSQLTSSSK